MGLQMSKMLMKGILASAVLAALVGCNSDDDVKVPTTCAEAGAECKIFTVLHTNDNHGRFWENKDGEYGMAARKALIDQIRAQVSANGGESILLSGGDINTGVPESDLQDAIPDFIGMNEIRYEAMAVGNHEFDNPLAVLDSQRSIANFPMLAESMGCVGLSCERPEDLDKTIEKAMSINDQPVVVDFRVHRDAMVWPMVAAGTSNDEIMIARATAPDWDSQEL